MLCLKFDSSSIKIIIRIIDEKRRLFTARELTGELHHIYINWDTIYFREYSIYFANIRRVKKKKYFGRLWLQYAAPNNQIFAAFAEIPNQTRLWKKGVKM